MAFTSWTALKEQMLNDLASGNWRATQSYKLNTGAGSREITFRSIDDFMKLLAMVEERAAQEQGCYGQICAVPGRRV